LAKDPGYKDLFKRTKDFIVGSEHFSNARIEAKVNAVKANGKILRPELAAQKTSGVHRTGECQGLIKYIAVKKPSVTNGSGHYNDLKEELEYRGLSTPKFKDMFMKEAWTKGLVNWLKKHEIERVKKESNEDKNAVEQAKQYFKPLSGVTFGEVTPLPANTATKPKKSKALKPLKNTAPKRKRCSKRTRY
jgi:hypothetical protein